MFESVKNSLFLKQAINKSKAILRQYIKRQLMRVGRKCTSRMHSYRLAFSSRNFMIGHLKKVSPVNSGKTRSLQIYSLILKVGSRSSRLYPSRNDLIYEEL